MGSIRIDNAQHAINAAILPLSPALPTADTAQPTVSKTPASLKPTVNLFDQSSYNAIPAVELTDGTTVTLPTSSAEDQQTFQNLFAKVPDDQKDALNAASANIASAVRDYVQQMTPAEQPTSAAGATKNLSAQIQVNADASASTTQVGGANAVQHFAVGGVAKLNKSVNDPSTQAAAPVDGIPGLAYTISQSSPDVAGVQSAISSAASTYNAATGTGEGQGGYDATVQAVAFMGVQGLQQGLGDYAQQMQAQIDSQKTLRVDQSEMASAVADWPSGATTQSFTWHEVDANGNLQTHTADLTQSAAKDLSNTLSNQLSAMGDDTQLMQTHLQDMEQNYQQGITMISNIMKMQYDMVKNTIGNIHY